MSQKTGAWLLLLHQIPPSPPYLRAKILRRLKQIGALALKKSAYVLPETDDTVEDFQWLLKEILSEGAEGWIFRVNVVAGSSDESLREEFRKLRSEDYRELLAEAQSLKAQTVDGGEEDSGAREARLRKLRKRFGEASRIDFFDAPGKQEVVSLMDDIEAVLRRDKPRTGAGKRTESASADAVGGRWVTRKEIKIDRTACTWLIRRFIDSSAEFAFVEPNQYPHQPGDLRFDMFEGEFTHEGDRCSFEVLMDRYRLERPALKAIAEIVHDLDLKDAKFGRPEAAGVAAMIDGLCLRHKDDTQRMQEGLIVFDSLYAQLSARREA